MAGVSSCVTTFDKWLQDAQEKPTTPKEPEGEAPLLPFRNDRFLDRLATNKLPGLPPPINELVSRVTWGSRPGAVRVVLTPQLNVKIQRLVKNRKGNDVWVLKRFYFMNDQKMRGREEELADHVWDKVRNMYADHLDGLRVRFTLKMLAAELVREMSVKAFKAVSFDSAKRVSEREFQLIFYVKGGGVGVLTGAIEGQKAAVMMVVSVSFDVETYLYRVMAYFIQNIDDNASWSIQPPQFDEYFAPNQDLTEIVHSVMTALKWF